VRVDIEDRNFHWETKRNGGADHHFSANTRDLPQPQSGFAFTPSSDRSLRVVVDHGIYHSQPEWSENIPHPVEQSRGQTGSGDAYSPGWFEIPMSKGAEATLVVTADTAKTEVELLERAVGTLRSTVAPATESGDAASTIRAGDPVSSPSVKPGDVFQERLLQALSAFVVTRGTGKTIIAGYPWFLDWGRDTFIAARGLLAAGMLEEVKQIALTFARFEQNGTLPNTIFGEDASNRDTSDAPLWFGVVCEELQSDLDQLRPLPGRTLHQVLESIASNYINGTPNGIRMDPGSGLVWSPSHFTWMDTNYPACTPRAGYPVEIQALWIRLLRQLASLSGGPEAQRWIALAEQAQSSVEKLFWSEEKGYYADVLSIPDRGRSRSRPGRCR
jgi:predicted glycogen debranching enzyme